MPHCKHISDALLMSIHNMFPWRTKKLSIFFLLEKKKVPYSEVWLVKNETVCCRQNSQAITVKRNWHFTFILSNWISSRVNVLKFRTLYSVFFWLKFYFLCICLLKCLVEWHSGDPDQTTPHGAVWSWSALFAYSILSETLVFKILGHLLCFHEIINILNCCLI